MKNETTMFEIIGYTKDYYFNNKYVGAVRMEQPDRDHFGYIGRITEVLEEDITIGKKKLKKGSVVKTEMNKLCWRKK